MKQVTGLLIVCLGMLRCATSITVPVKDVRVDWRTDTPELTIFLLERDIPQPIQQLGVVTIPMKLNSLNLKQIDTTIKARLSEQCKAAGANGAYRINEGTYPPYAVSYLIFHYSKKQESK